MTGYIVEEPRGERKKVKRAIRSDREEQRSDGGRPERKRGICGSGESSATPSESSPKPPKPQGPARFAVKAVEGKTGI